jgi:hypothetical protein
VRISREFDSPSSCSRRGRYLLNLPRKLLLPICHKRKSKDLPLGHEGAKGERKYNSCSFFISAVDGGERSASRLGYALPPGKETSVPIGSEAGWASKLVWTQARGKIPFLCRGSNPGHIFLRSYMSSPPFSLHGCNETVSLCQKRNLGRFKFVFHISSHWKRWQDFCCRSKRRRKVYVPDLRLVPVSVTQCA